MFARLPCSILVASFAASALQQRFDHDDAVIVFPIAVGDEPGRHKPELAEKINIVRGTHCLLHSLAFSPSFFLSVLSLL